MVLIRTRLARFLAMAAVNDSITSSISTLNIFDLNMNISETFPVLPKMAEERLRLDYSLIVAVFVSAAFFNATS